MHLNPITALDEAIDCVENGRSDEALLHLNMLRRVLSKNCIDAGIFHLTHEDKSVTLPGMTNRIEVIDHGLKENCRQVITYSASGGTLELQDGGRTAKLFIRSQSKG